MKEKNNYMLAAINLAKSGMEAGIGGPFGALVVKDNTVIARGQNRVTSDNDPTAHAEIIAIREACRKLNSYQLKGCTIYTSCEPCPMCLGAIYWARPEKVYFAALKTDAAKVNFDDRFIYDQIKLDFNNRQIKFENLMRDEAVKIFGQWEKMADKKIY